MVVDIFCSCDLDLDPMTFILYELDPYSMEIRRMCEYELPRSALSKVMSNRQTYRKTDGQTKSAEILNNAALRVIKNNRFNSCSQHSWRAGNKALN